MSKAKQASRGTNTDHTQQTGVRSARRTAALPPYLPAPRLDTSPPHRAPTSLTHTPSPRLIYACAHINHRVHVNTRLTHLTDRVTLLMGEGSGSHTHTRIHTACPAPSRPAAFQRLPRPEGERSARRWSIDSLRIQLLIVYHTTMGGRGGRGPCRVTLSHLPPLTPLTPLGTAGTQGSGHSSRW